MAVIANREQFRKSFKRHLAVYRRAVADEVKESSHCMLLFYAVECGLKALILRENGKDNQEEFHHNNEKSIRKFFNNVGHDLNHMIDLLNFGEDFKIPDPDHQYHRSKDIHSMWRYIDGVYRNSNNEESNLDDAEQKLCEISREIEGRLR